jgi:CheY-like chemotaxis protein
MAKLDSLGVLAGGIAHDFNNLLTGIIGNLSLASTRHNDPDWVRDRISDAENAARRARGLTRQLMTFARGGNPVLRPISLEERLEETCRFALVGSNAKAEVIIEDDLWSVEADQGQINQVIQNLVLNASQAMPEGGQIRITAKNVILIDSDEIPSMKGKYVRIDVEDEGRGISPEIIDRIFEPYFTTKETGNGLGLASCYSIVRHHGGQISVSSEVGKGTRFVIHLPAMERSLGPSDNKLIGADMFRGNVLVMDSDEVVLNMMGDMLNTLGFEVLAAREGSGAINLCKRLLEDGKKIKAAFVGLDIPGGKETARRILEIQKDAHMVALMVGEDQQSTGMEPFVCVLNKPMRLTDLRRALDLVIEKDEAAEESKKEG